MISTNYLIAWLLKLKNPAIITAMLYVIAFVALFPYLIHLHLPVSDTLLVLLGMVLAIVIVSLLLNWAYVATMAFPMAAALLLFFVGWLVYIMAPLFDAIGQLLIAVLNGLISGFGAGGATGNITAAFHDLSTIGDHVGQFFITVGAGIYIHAKVWVGKINYIAVGTFVTVFALLGVAMGLTGLSGVAVFLVIWLMFYMRMQGSSSDDTVADLRIIFKVVATLVILIGSGVIHFSVSYFDGLQSSYSQYGGMPSSYGGGNAFLEIWRYFWTIGLLVGTWKPKWLWKLVPNQYTQNIKELLGMAGKAK